MGDHLYYTCIVGMAIMFLFEFFVDQAEHTHLYNRRETINNIKIGLGLFSISFISKGLLFGALQLAANFRIFDISNTTPNFLILIILSDFSFYWYHRASHKVAWFWAAHSVHHSAEHYNLSVTFRQSWTTQLSGQFLFWLWLPFIGFNPIWVFTSFQLCMFYQTWLHTVLIKKLPAWFEFLFNTPSHHRVHHGSNSNYLDKNHGGILIIWDRLFGTFTEEREHPVYGLPGKNMSPSISGTMWNEWKDLFQKVRTAKSFIIAIRYLVHPPGWEYEKTASE